MLQKVPGLEGRHALPMHDVPDGDCPYCGTGFDDPLGGWRQVCPSDPYDPDPLSKEDIHVKEWGGYFRVCDNCNPDGERWPAGLTVTLVPEETLGKIYAAWGRPPDDWV